MRFSHFQIQILLRIIPVTIGLYGFVYYWFIEENYIRVFFLLLFCLIMVLSLFRYITKTNKDTQNFLQAIIHNDFTIKYNATHQGKSHDDLYKTFNLVNQKFIESSQHEAAQYQYIVTLINQLQIGVLACDDQYRVHLANDAFKRLVGQKELIRLESIRPVNGALYEQIKNIKNGENFVFKTTIKGQVHRLSMAASVFKLRSNRYKLISFQDIHSELDQNEMEAWQKLIRVLTHEIMNSVAPITSLSTTLKSLVRQNELDEQKIKSLDEGLDAIEVRSQGLMNFTQAYRALTRIPFPNITEVNARAFLQRINSLFAPTLSAADIRWTLKLPDEDLTLLIDPSLMEQVLINLLKNAREAVQGQGGQISLSLGQLATGSVLIKVEDNGHGIPEKVAENIFIPFYTTKSEGSGIGLSLARQIVQMHQGEINFETSSKGTVFSIKL